MNLFGNPYQNPMFFQQPMDQLAQLRQPYQQPIPQMAPMPQIQPLPMAPQGSILWVKSQQIAEGLQIPPNNAISAWDENQPYVYIIKTDATGKTSFSKLRVTEERDGKTTPQYATIEDLQALEARLLGAGYAPKFLKEDTAHE